MSEPPRFSRSDYLQHIHEACALILEYTRGMSKADSMAQDARHAQCHGARILSVNVEVVGETVATSIPDLRSRIAELVPA